MMPQFRLADVLDRPLLLEMMREFYAYEGFPFDAMAATQALERILSDPSLGGVWVIEQGEDPVGYVVLTLGFSLEFLGRDAFVDELYIREAQRGQGLGTAALDYLIEICKSWGVNALHLEVDNEDEKVQNFYLKNGFINQPRHLMTRWIRSESGGANL